MRDMVEWYVDNHLFYSTEYLKNIIKYCKESEDSMIQLKDIVLTHNPNARNASAMPTWARDYAIIGGGSQLSDAAILYDSGVINSKDFALISISKRNALKNEASYVKPLVLIAKFFSSVIKNHEFKNVFISTAECKEYLSVLDTYDEFNDDIADKIINERIYSNAEVNIPQRRINLDNKVYLSALFSLLESTVLFKWQFDDSKDFITIEPKYIECINYIACFGDNISIAPIGTNRDDKYNYNCDISTGILEIIPELPCVIKKIPTRLIKRFYEYLFDVEGSVDFPWDKYFNSDCRGIYRPFFPIQNIVIVKIYLSNNSLGELLWDYVSQSKLYIDYYTGDKLMIRKPYEDSSHTSINSLVENICYDNCYNSAYPHNLIIFGAPGTGKSFTLQENIDSLLKNKGVYERVTFYPDYTYQQFVGSYKPVSNGNDINYEFVPGPFMRIWVEAVKNILESIDDNNYIDVAKIKPHVLVIEEINRAKAASVFGDVFQLLDRNEYGASEYYSYPSQEMINYIASELNVEAELIKRIKIPNNLHIWATMNSADQGVFPMDTAFKRRWDFIYIGIDDEEFDVVTDDSGTKIIKEIQNDKFNIAGDSIEWNVLRRSINALLSSEELRVHEDKLLGPFFIKVLDRNGNSIFNSSTKDNDFINLFCNKVLMYLMEDVVRTRRQDFFNSNLVNYNRFSSISDGFKKYGISIFGDKFKEEYYDKQVLERDTKKNELKE